MEGRTVIFEDTYFKDEVIDGFYVPGIIKRLWAQQLEILEDIKHVCKEIGISFYAGYGTLLGAKRHGGFVPWDDDIDLWMKRKDYMRFMECAKKYLPDNYEVRSVYSVKSGFEDMIIWVVNSDAIRFDEEFLKKYHGCPFRLGVDIFPLDKLPSKDDEEAFIALSDLVTAAIYMADSKEASEEERKEAFSLVEGYCGVKLVYDETLKQQLIRIKDMVHSSFISDSSDELAEIMYWKRKKDFRLKTNWLGSAQDVKFENTTIPVPAESDKVLNCLFGDWKKHVQGKADHEYPIIAEQQRLLVKTYGIEYGKFLPDKVPESRSLEKNNKWLFIPFSDEYWENMQELYGIVKGNPANESRVLPVPYYIKKYENPKWHKKNQADIVLEAFKDNEADDKLLSEVLCMNYPDDLQVEQYKTFDIEGYSPDVIVIQCPYDENGSSITVAPDYYVKELRDKCKCLIYIPFFNISDFSNEDTCSIINATYYAVTPAVMFSDFTVLPSERIREIYMEAAKSYLSETEIKILSEKLVIMDELSYRI